MIKIISPADYIAYDLPGSESVAMMLIESMSIILFTARKKYFVN